MVRVPRTLASCGNRSVRTKAVFDEPPRNSAGRLAGVPASERKTNDTLTPAAPLFERARPVALPFVLSKGSSSVWAGAENAGTAASKTGLPGALKEKTPLATSGPVEDATALPSWEPSVPDET